jgi:hypothetical protein
MDAPMWRAAAKVSVASERSRKVMYFDEPTASWLFGSK